MKHLCIFSWLVTISCFALAQSSGQSEVNFGISGITFVFTLIGIIVGAAGNHFLSINRDRRKEFNEIADPVRQALRSERQRVTPYGSALSTSDVGKLADLMSDKQAQKFKNAADRYFEARKQWTIQDEVGQVMYSQTAHIEDAIDVVIDYLDRR